MKRGRSWLLIAAMIVSFLTLPGITVSAEGEKAEKIALSVTCSDREQDCRLVLDNKEKTKIRVKKRTNFTVKSKQPFRNLYIKFEKESEWVITLPDGTKIRPGEENYAHKFIRLEQDVASFVLTMPAYSGLTDLYAFSEGALPDWVQLWQPPCERADLMVMPAHADDEFLWFGGAMPYYAGELGYDVQVVYLTNHNNATIRNHERLNALWLVGIRHYPVISPFLDVNDSRYSADDAAREFGGYRKVMAFQVEQVRRFRPKVILAHDIKGEYGHGAHMLDAKTVLEAAKISGDPSEYSASAKQYGTYQVQKVYLHLWKENQIVVNWSDKVLSRFGGKTALDMAKEGFDCNKSQIISVKVEESGRYDCRKFGLAYTTVGNDTPGVNDFFEHIDMSDKPDPAGTEAASSAPSSQEGDDSSLSSAGHDAPPSVSPADAGRHAPRRTNHTADMVLSGAAIMIMALVCVFRRSRKRA